MKGHPSSPPYLRALEAATKHHASSKTYSGKLMRPHARYIKEDIIDRLGIESVLDYGCGKGSQYTWRNQESGGSIPTGMTIEEYWGIQVVKYDPAYPPFAKEPTGKFDLVLCTHTLGAIPVSDLPWVIHRLHKLASKAIFVAEKLGDTSTKDIHNADNMPRGWSQQKWADVIRASHVTGVEVHLAARKVTSDGIIVDREIIAR